MKLARIQTSDGPKTVVETADGWAEVSSIFDPTPTGQTYPLDAKLLAPCEPRVIVAVIHNAGPEHRKLPLQAVLKSARTAVGTGDTVWLSRADGETIAEGELCAVIGKTARNLTPENALEHVLGYTIANDVTAIGQCGFDDKWTQAKNGDGFTPIGPWIETTLDPTNVGIKVFIDDDLKADSSTSKLAYNLTEELVYLTRHLTLGPGDLILTGAPFTGVPYTAGQRARIEIPEIGTLENPSR